LHEFEGDANAGLDAKVWTFEAKAETISPEAEAFKHMTIEEIKIRSTSDSLTGLVMN